MICISSSLSVAVSSLATADTLFGEEEVTLVTCRLVSWLASYVEDEEGGWERVARLGGGRSSSERFGVKALRFPKALREGLLGASGAGELLAMSLWSGERATCPISQIRKLGEL